MIPDDAATDRAVSDGMLTNIFDAAATDTAVSDGLLTDSPASDNPIPSDTRNPTDVPSSDARTADAGTLVVTCAHRFPFVVVGQTTGGGAATTLLRVPLQFSRAASEITITSVSERTLGPGAVTLRDWSVASLRAPAGFTGTATPRPGDPTPVVQWTATAPSVTAETNACAQRPWQRPGGVVHVSGSTREGGRFEIDCSTGLNSGGRGPEPLRFVCARGVAGWLGGSQTSVSTMTTPFVAVLAESDIHVHHFGTAAATGFTATGATVTAHVDNTVRPPGTMCPTTDPPAWTLGGSHSLSVSTSGAPVDWSGPAEPNTQVDAHWFFQEHNLVAPSGYCVPRVTPPMSPCPVPPVLQIVMTGQSSAGSFEWESDLFNCFMR